MPSALLGRDTEYFKRGVMKKVIHGLLYRDQIVVQRAGLPDAASPPSEWAVIIFIGTLEEFKHVVELDCLGISSQRSPTVPST